MDIHPAAAAAALRNRARLIELHAAAGMPVDDLVKSAVPGLGALPVGSQLVELGGQAAVIAQQETGGYLPLPREPQPAAFGPGQPFLPVAIDPRLPSGRPLPRISEYDVSANLQLSDPRRRPFQILRTAGDIDVLRRCCEVRKNQICSLEWDITLSSKALERIMAETGETSPGKAQRIARDRYGKDIARLSTWWEKPDRANGLDFAAWLGLLLEERFVIDATSIYPRRNLGGDVVGFEIIDGATIKPLLDHRGATPVAPFPAFQQILHGFPRGEFTAASVADGEFSTDQLIYRPRVRRTWTPYGLSNVEQSLNIVDIYLKRMGWVRGEFDDSARPDLWAETDMEVQPEALAMYEAVFNDALAGQLQQRRWLKMLPKGVKLHDTYDFAEKYNPDLDEFLIKLLCMCWDVMPTEIGFPPKSGIGGKGHQEGEESATYRKGIRPEATWLNNLLTELSRTYLGMPDDLAFSLIGYEIENQIEQEQAADLRIRSGRSTLNWELARRGAPLFDFAEADTPFVVTGSGLVFLDGAMQAQADRAAPAPPVPPVLEADDAIDAPPTSATDPRPELTKFAGFAKKRFNTGRWRAFDFTGVDANKAAALNELGDLAAHGNSWALEQIKTAAQAEPQEAAP